MWARCLRADRVYIYIWVPSMKSIVLLWARFVSKYWNINMDIPLKVKAILDGPLFFLERNGPIMNKYRVIPDLVFINL